MAEQLRQIFNLERIAKVYVVDDALSASQTPIIDEFIGALKTVQEKGQLADLSELAQGIDFLTNEPILDEYAAEIWEAANPSVQLTYLRRVYELAGFEQALTGFNISGVLNFLFADQHMSDMLEIMSPQDWQSKSDNIADGLKEEERAIVLFDLHLERAGEPFDRIDGMQLAAEAFSKPYQTKLLLGILSFAVTDMGLELVERERLVKENPGTLSSKDLFVLAKIRTEDLALLVDGFKKMLLNGRCEKIKFITSQVVSDAFHHTMGVINQLDTYDFDYTVLRSSLKEGVWEPDTLLRLISVIFRDQTKQLLLSRNQVPVMNKLLEEAHLLSKIDVKVTSSQSPYSERYKLRFQEMYADGSLINGLGKPIENGDIFTITDGRKIGSTYMLVGQECDLMLRSDSGDRATRIGHLLKLDMKTESELDELIRISVSQREKLRKFNFWQQKSTVDYIEVNSINHKIGLITMARAVIVDLDVLDLCAFDADGQAKFDVTQVHNEDRFSVAMRLRYKYLQKLYKNKAKEISIYTTGLAKVDQNIRSQLLEQIMPKLTLGELVGLSKTFQTASNTFTFGVKRIRALRDPKAAQILSKYTSFLSRTAEQHDFAD